MTILFRDDLLNALATRLVRIETKLDTLLKETNIMTTDFSQLEAELSKNTSAVDSAVNLIQSIKAQLDAAGTDPVKLKALSDQLAANDARLAKAVADNTPAADNEPTANIPVNPTPGQPAPVV